MSDVGQSDSCRGWLLTLADGRRFAWNEREGVRSADEARERLLAQEPGAEILSVEEEELLMSVYLSEN